MSTSPPHDPGPAWQPPAGPPPAGSPPAGPPPGGAHPGGPQPGGPQPGGAHPGGPQPGGAHPGGPQPGGYFAPPPAPAADQRKGLPVVTGLAGLLIGGVLVGLIWVGASLVGPGGNDSDDAANACALIERMPATGMENLAGPDGFRLSAAYSLAEAAAAEDPGHRDLAVALRDTWRGVQTRNVEILEEGMAETNRLCADL